jgi:glycosyltransferase involved in cell wall biosynthesis
LKVLVLSHTSELSGGAEQSMLDLFDYWHKVAGIEPEFIIRKPVHKLASELKKRGFTYHSVYYTNWAQRRMTHDPGDMYWYAKQNTLAVAKIEKIIVKTKPDLVITNTIVAPWAAFAAYNQKIPHAWFVREFGDAESDFEFRIGQSETFKAIGELSELVVANSEALAQFARKFIDKNKVRILYPNIESQKISKLSKTKITPPFRSPDSLKLVITGRIAPFKGQHMVVAAIGILRNQGIDCELCIVGEPSSQSDADLLHAAIDKYQISDSVHLVGHQDNPFPYIALADVGIMSSSKEAFGRATLEYMTLGKAVVGSSAGATPELIKEGSNGYLYNPKDPNALVKVLRKYASNRQLLHDHGQASAKRAKVLSTGNYSPDKLAQYLRHILEKKSRSSRPTSTKDINRWNRYPVLITAATKKPKVQLSGTHIRTSSKRFLKHLYVILK